MSSDDEEAPAPGAAGEEEPVERSEPPGAVDEQGGPRHGRGKRDPLAGVRTKEEDALAPRAQLAGQLEEKHRLSRTPRREEVSSERGFGFFSRAARAGSLPRQIPSRRASRPGARPEVRGDEVDPRTGRACPTRRTGGAGRGSPRPRGVFRGRAGRHRRHLRCSPEACGLGSLVRARSSGESYSARRGRPERRGAAALRLRPSGPGTSYDPGMWIGGTRKTTGGPDLRGGVEATGPDARNVPIRRGNRALEPAPPGTGAS